MDVWIQTYDGGDVSPGREEGTEAPKGGEVFKLKFATEEVPVGVKEIKVTLKIWDATTEASDGVTLLGDPANGFSGSGKVITLDFPVNRLKKDEDSGFYLGEENIFTSWTTDRTPEANEIFGVRIIDTKPIFDKDAEETDVDITVSRSLAVTVIKNDDEIGADDTVGVLAEAIANTNKALSQLDKFDITPKPDSETETAIKDRIKKALQENADQVGQKSENDGDKFLPPEEDDFLFEDMFDFAGEEDLPAPEEPPMEEPPEDMPPPEATDPFAGEQFEFYGEEDVPSEEGPVEDLPPMPDQDWTDPGITDHADMFEYYEAEIAFEDQTHEF